MNKLKAVFWDVDGTLADTEMCGHRLAFNLAFKDFDLIKENTYLALDRISFAMRDGYTTAEMIGERMKREMSYERVEVGGVRDYVKTNQRKFSNSDIRKRFIIF